MNSDDVSWLYWLAGLALAADDSKTGRIVAAIAGMAQARADLQSLENTPKVISKYADD